MVLIVRGRNYSKMVIKVVMRQTNELLIEMGKKIRHLRKTKGFSQEAFALYVGLDRSYFGSIERGERNVPILNVVRIAKALGVEVSEIIPSIAELTDFKAGQSK